jgi:hypothetical protein
VFFIDTNGLLLWDTVATFAVCLKDLFANSSHQLLFKCYKMRVAMRDQDRNNLWREYGADLQYNNYGSYLFARCSGHASHQKMVLSHLDWIGVESGCLACMEVVHSESWR